MEIKNIDYRKIQKKTLLDRINNLPETAFIPNFNDIAEQDRFVPRSSSPFYGPHKRTTVPQFQEILDRLHPDDPVKWVSLQKSVQSAGTYHAECAILAYIKYKIGTIGFYTATQDLAKERSNKNIDPLIDYSGLTKYLKPHSDRNKRKKNDSTFYKEFDGGISLLIKSYGSIAGMKSNTIDFMILDEIDEAKEEMKGQGNTLAILEGRTSAVRNAKVFALSTPTNEESSHINHLFKEGDQRYYHVPCPKCGEKQVLVLKMKDEKGGLTFKREKDKNGYLQLVPESVLYECKYCGHMFRESKKNWMLNNGVWIPSATASDPFKTSYHVSALMSPEFALSWQTICQKYINSDFGRNVLVFKDFTINYLGNPWKKVRKKQKWDNVYEKRILGKRAELIEPILQINAGADVHKNRIELIVVGWGSGAKSWVIERQTFYGNTSSIDSEVWENLALYCENAKYTDDRKSREIGITQVAIDQGYNPSAKEYNSSEDFAEKRHVVKDFCIAHWQFIPVRGVTKQQYIFKEERQSKQYAVSTDALKLSIYDRIRETVKGGLETGTIDFFDLEEPTFKEIMSEVWKEQKDGSYKWDNEGRDNHCLDCLVYANASAHILGIYSRTKEMWNMYKNLQ